MKFQMMRFNPFESASGSSLDKTFRKSFNGNSGFPYTNTRVRVMKTRLLGGADYKRLMNMSVPEITRFLEESDYKTEIDSLSQQFKGLNLIEYSLMKNLERTFKRIYDFSLKQANQQLGLFLKKWDYWNIKILLRGLQTKSNKNEIMHNMVLVGDFKSEFFERILNNAQTIEQAIDYFKDTNFYPILSKHKNSLAKLEDELDRFYYLNLLENSSKELRNFGKNQIKSINTLNMLRLKDLDSKKDFLIPGMDEIMQVPEGLDDLEKIAYVKREQLENGLHKMHSFKSNMDPLLGYFTAKEIEVNNLRMIIRGKQTGIAAEKIEKSLVYLS
ncbi:MAG: V-type ATPase subunit [Candidatus Diapherotrites archaeon]|nr:V-type ATPase subunit [Candidatus Diapherotrites archaeon]